MQSRLIRDKEIKNAIFKRLKEEAGENYGASSSQLPDSQTACQPASQLPSQPASKSNRSALISAPLSSCSSGGHSLSCAGKGFWSYNALWEYAEREFFLKVVGESGKRKSAFCLCNGFWCFC
jgi:hypothetical protein